MEGLAKPEASDKFPFYRILDPDIRQRLYALLNVSPEMPFPGSMCVSLERSHLTHIVSEPYWVCEKSDGYRFLLFVLRHKNYKVVCLVGRHPKDVFLTPFTKVPRTWYDGTILDGELVCDDGRWTFLAFDALLVAGRDVRTMPFSGRYRAMADAFDPYAPSDTDKILFKIKKFYAFHAFEECLRHAQSHRFPTDGFIFTSENDPVLFGRNFRMFKWKEASSHTIDFMLADQGQLCVYDRGQPVRVGALSNKSDGLPVGAIVECKIDNFEQGTWTYVKVRDDKTYPNDVLTFQRTLINIQENITLDDLKNILRCK